MHLLNLTLGQFLALFGSMSAVMLALYLLDRSRRRQVVSTLRFWVSAEQPTVVARRRRIQQPFSLLLQLASIALLLLAIAQLRLGMPASAPRDHVLILDTSAWMAARTSTRTLMDLARDRARAYVRAVPARDRIMLVRADALTTPAPAPPPRLCPPRPRAHPHHAGPRRRPSPPRHGLRTRPAETGRSHRPIRARRHRVEPGPGARLCTADSGAERTPRRRSGLRGHGQTRRTRTGQAGPAQPAVLERARCGR